MCAGGVRRTRVSQKMQQAQRKVQCRQRRRGKRGERGERCGLNDPGVVGHNMQVCVQTAVKSWNERDVQLQCVERKETSNQQCVV